VERDFLPEPHFGVMALQLGRLTEDLLEVVVYRVLYGAWQLVLIVGLSLILLFWGGLGRWCVGDRSFLYFVPVRAFRQDFVNVLVSVRACSLS
jgi:hypothetical protein